MLLLENVNIINIIILYETVLFIIRSAFDGMLLF